VVEQYNHGLQQLAAGRPLAYVIGQQGFWKHEFLVDQSTLIPRPDTEILVETVLQLTKNSLSKPKKILDLGTGSGCIAISLAAELAKSHITAVDISLQALQIAMQNANRVGVTNLDFLQGHWYQPIKTECQFDVIVSNPPYIDPQDSHLAALSDEPITALIADEQGLADLRHIIAQAPNYLKDAGILVLEHGYDQAQSVRQMLAIHGFIDINTVRDYGGNERVTYGQWSN
jgi:release factor glutamine methyltransferase